MLSRYFVCPLENDYTWRNNYSQRETARDRIVIRTAKGLA